MSGRSVPVAHMHPLVTQVDNRSVRVRLTVNDANESTMEQLTAFVLHLSGSAIDQSPTEAQRVDLPTHLVAQVDNRSIKVRLTFKDTNESTTEQLNAFVLHGLSGSATDQTPTEAQRVDLTSDPGHSNV